MTFGPTEYSRILHALFNRNAGIVIRYNTSFGILLGSENDYRFLPSSTLLIPIWGPLQVFAHSFCLGRPISIRILDRYPLLMDLFHDTSAAYLEQSCLYESPALETYPLWSSKPWGHSSTCSASTIVIPAHSRQDPPKTTSSESVGYISTLHLSTTLDSTQ